VTESEQNRPVRAPTPPLEICGFGRIRHVSLPRDQQFVLRVALDAADTPRPVPQTWGLLYVLDRTQTRFTLYSHDPDYVAMLTIAAPPLPGDVFTDKFVFFHPGWDPAAQLRAD
jgi:hypothetical protein